jgi:hypothetical protein
LKTKKINTQAIAGIFGEIFSAKDWGGIEVSPVANQKNSARQNNLPQKQKILGKED